MITQPANFDQQEINFIELQFPQNEGFLLCLEPYPIWFIRGNKSIHLIEAYGVNKYIISNITAA